MFLLLLFAVSVPRLASAQDYPRYPAVGSTYVSLDSWIYPALERLAALGYIHTEFLGLRPWTRVECARLVEEAGDRIREEHSESQQAIRLHRQLSSELAEALEALGGGRNAGLRVESLYARFMGIAGSPLRDSYHFGQTIANDYGRPFAEGANGVAGFSARAVRGRFALYVQGEYQHAPNAPALPERARKAIAEADLNPLQPAVPFAAVDQFRLLDTYAAVNLQNWQVSFGKQSLWWGPGHGGSLLLSNNAEPIYMLRINRVVPLKLPGIFRWLGPVRIDSFFGKLSGHHFPARPLFHGQKISFKPTPNLEFGFSRTTVFSGVGRPLTFRRLWRSYFDIGINPNSTSETDPGDRRSAFDFTYRVPGLRRWLIVYVDSLVDDDPSPLAAPRRAAMNPGLYIPQLPGLPKLDFRIEHAYTDVPDDRSAGGKFIYWNGDYRDSHTNKGNLMGSWVGREGRGLQFWSTYWLSPQSTIQVSYRKGKVSPDFMPGGGKLDDVAVRADLQIHPDLSLSTFVQYERWNFPVLSDRGQSNLTSSFQLTFRPHGRSK
ncbi:MAG: capsule assembly Wzi family protein [Acidobacteria bacterium]|nr:capsule assembly Wzi family protein [Acidobacteriota bacterium]